jgi:hypothetical protein
MRHAMAIAILLAALTPGEGVSQATIPSGDGLHVAVEATSLVLDQERVRSLGLDGLSVSGGAAITPGHGSGVVLVSRVGSLEVAGWLRLVRSNRAVRHESTLRVVTLSGSAARLSSGRTLIGAYGQTASGGSELWVEPVALEDGLVRLRVWVTAADVRVGPAGDVWRDAPVEASTELVVPDGTPVLIASNEQVEERSGSGLLHRRSAGATTRAWVVVTPRVVADPAQAFDLPDGFPGERPRR